MVQKTTQKDGTVIIGGAGLPTRMGRVGSGWSLFGPWFDKPCSFADGAPPRIGDMLGFDVFNATSVVQITRVYDTGNVDAIHTGNQWVTPQDTGKLFIGSVGLPAFQNGWAPYTASGGIYEAPWVRIKQGIAYLGGLATGGTVNTVLFTLPPGWRPMLNHIFSADMQQINTGGATAGTAHTHGMISPGGRVDVASNGNVSQSGSANNGYQSLSGIMVFCEQ